MVPNNNADIIPTTTLPLFADIPGAPLELEPELEPELVPEVEELDPAEAVPVLEEEPAEEVGATEARFFTELQDALVSADVLV